MFNSKVTDRKRGAFRDWKEDDEIVEIFLPLPAHSIKKELTCTITATSLHVRHERLGQTLLKADPLAGSGMGAPGGTEQGAANHL